ncbi:MAG: sugar ABC transporter substrate-binding protein [Hespellia sp.]|nr:sugar ABC transporter substrate-binding protein [Hespellia sp.]
MKKKVLSVILVAAMVVAIAGCGKRVDSSGSSADTGSKETAEESADIDTSENYLKGKTINVLLKSYTHMFWVEAANEAEMLGEQYGCTVNVLAPTVANSNEEQIELIENSLLDPPDLYIIVPADSEGISPAITEINDEGVPIVNVNTKISDESVSYDSFVSCNQYDLGYTTVSKAIEKIGEEGKAVTIYGKPGAQTYEERDKGANAAFDEHEGWELLDSQVANGDRNEAMDVMSTLLTKYDDITMVYAQDGEMALGAAEALKQSGKQNDIKIVCENSSAEICEQISAGNIFMTYDDAAWSQTEVGFKVANLILGEQKVADTYYSDIYLVDSDNVEEYAQRYAE